MDLEYVRPLPPELLVEMHKCLPLANQIYVLVNVSKTFVINNSTRMRRNIQRIKTSLNEYIGTLVNDEADRKILRITNDLEWKPELDALFRYGTWLTPAREFQMGWNRNIIVGVPKNFVEELLLHMANSRCSSQMTLHRVKMNFGMTAMPIPKFLKQLFNKNQYRIEGRILFESVQLEMDNGQILHIFDGEFDQYNDNSSELRLFLMNKMDEKNWFQIQIDMDPSKKFIERLEFSKWKMQSFDDIVNFINGNGVWKNDKIKENGNKLEAKSCIHWNRSLDIFLRRGAGLTQLFRHLKISGQYVLYCLPIRYAGFLINSIAYTKHPEDFLESIEMNLLRGRSPLIHKIWKICDKGISEDGKFFKFEGKKFHILSGKTEQLNEWNYKLEFTLANGPTNGGYLFDVEVQFRKEGPKKIVKVKGIKIQKRKVDDNIEMKCDEQIGQGKKRKAANNDEGEEDEDGPTCSNKIMKK